MEEVRAILHEAIGRDLAEFQDVAMLLRTLFRMLLAALLGGLIGLERTVRGRPAGMRTYMIVSLGAAAFVLVAEQSGIGTENLSRVVQGILTGIGFLGAGAIVKGDDPRRAGSLATAAGIWLTAAVGLAVGMGRLAAALLLSGIALLILAPLRPVEEAVEAWGYNRASRGRP